MGVNECSNNNRYVVSKNAASQKGQFLSPGAGFVPVPNKGVIAPSMIRMSILLRQAILIHIVGVFSDLLKTSSQHNMMKNCCFFIDLG